MARFRLQQAFSFGSVRLNAGHVIVDTAANALAGDVVFPSMNSATLPAGVVALDGAALTMFNASRWGVAGVQWGAPSGTDSING